MTERNTAAIAVVTGASRGAGLGIAVALGSHGCTVYVTGRSAEGRRFTPIRHDLRDCRRSDRRGRQGHSRARRSRGRCGGKEALRSSPARRGTPRHPGQQRLPHPRRSHEPGQLLGKALRGRRHARRRTAQQLCRQLLRRACTDRAKARIGDFHVVLGSGPLHLRSGVRRAQGRHGQARCRYGRGLPAVRCGLALHLDGRPLD